MNEHSEPTGEPAGRRGGRRSFLRSAAAILAASALDRSKSRDASAQEEPKASPLKDPLLTTENPAIIRARDAALDVLKPTTAQLEHGLELHRSSLVFDAYGFSPRAALDGPAFAMAIEAGASDAELQDLNEEQSMTRPALDPIERAEFDEALRCSGVTAIFQNAGEEGQDPLRLIKRLARFTFLTDMLRGTLVRATLPDDIEAAHHAGRKCLYMTGNGVPLPQQWVTVEAELGYVRLYFQLGIRMMHLTYNRRNMLGDGCAETANGGLSDFGRAAIAEMNRVGVIVDVAHSGWQTIRARMAPTLFFCAPIPSHDRRIITQQGDQKQIPSQGRRRAHLVVVTALAHALTAVEIIGVQCAASAQLQQQWTGARGRPERRRIHLLLPEQRQRWSGRSWLFAQDARVKRATTTTTQHKR